MKRLTAIAATAAMLLAGCGILPNGGAPTAEAPETPTTVTSPDGTISVTLPAGWHDFSAEYFADLPSSVLSALWGSGRDVDDRSAPFASVSTRPAWSGSGTAKSLAIAGAADWQVSMDGAITDEGAFSTQEGGEGYWHQIEGIEQGAEIAIFNVSILANGRTAKISIETYPNTPDIAEALLDALTTVSLAPVTAEEARTGAVIDGVYTDGTMHVTVPAPWEGALADDDLVSAAATAEAHLYGVWLLGLDAAGNPPYVILAVNDAVEGLDRVQRSKDDWGAPGSLVASAEGDALVVSVTDVAYENGAVGVIGCFADPLGAPDVALKCYVTVEYGDFIVLAIIAGLADYPEAVAQTELALSSLEILAG